MPPGQQLVDVASEIVKACENQGDVGPLGVKSMRLAIEVWQAESRLLRSTMRQPQTDKAISVLSKTLEHVRECSDGGWLGPECPECHKELDEAIEQIQAIPPKCDDPLEEGEKDDFELEPPGQAGSSHVTDAHELEVFVPAQNAQEIPTQRDPLVDQLINILKHPLKRRVVENLKGEFAQQAIDSLYWLLTQPSVLIPSLREDALLTFRKLCEASRLYPRHLRILRGTEGLDITSDNRLGDTYRGRYNGREISLKVIRLRGRAQRDMALKLSARESVLLCHLQHSNVVPFFGVYDLDQEPNAICRVTPWMKNGNVVTYLERNPKAPRTLLVSDIVGGLNYLHDMSIVHGDLKAMNVLIKDSGEACITDFELSPATINDTLGFIDAMDDLTFDYSSRRTIPWIAPELLEDDGRRSRASDVWAFACVCYEVISNRMPFQGQSDVEIFRKLAQGIPPAQRDSVSPLMENVNEIWELIDQCWRPDPSERPTSRQILKDCRQYGFVRRVEDSHAPAQSIQQRDSIVALDRAKVQYLLSKIDAGDDFSAHMTNSSGIVQEISKFPDDLEDPKQGNIHPEEQADHEMFTEQKRCWHHIAGKFSYSPHPFEEALRLLADEYNVDPVVGSPRNLQPIPMDYLDVLTTVLGSQTKRSALQELKGDRAQLLIDFLYLVLLQSPINYTTPWFRKHVLLALHTLCGASLLYPRWYMLKSITYRTIECSGGFCDIRRGKCGSLDLCLKVVRVTGPDQLNRMLKIYAREAILWGQLYHPNIVPFYGTFYLGEAEKRLCLVSPWMENGNIVAYLEGNPSATRKPFIYDVAKGLKYLHDKNIIHADLKGLNVLVNNSGNACITDFGLSVIWTDRTLGFTYTAGGVQGHSNRWAAPELVLAEDDSHPNQASDVWAFGCVCYEILTRKLPFHKYSRDYQILSQIMKGRLPAQREEELTSDPMDTVDGEMWSLINSCWLTEPERRPTCQDILLALGFDGSVEGIVFEDDNLAKESQYTRSMLGRNTDATIDITGARRVLTEL